MYLKINTVKRGSKTYRYAQIVESYRREDGIPTNRLIKSLGQRSDAEIAAIRATLEIARRGGTPVLPSEEFPRAKVLLTLRYLDVAVLRETWRQLGLRRLLSSVMAQANTDVPNVDVIEALVLQRCIAPGSKLAASRWYPNTVLPELQLVAPEQFHNSRVHRALGALEAAEGKLQDLLPEHLFDKLGNPSIFFLDATDTWFEGNGPPLAAKGRDKQGVFRRRVGIVLLCDHRGSPLRWHTLDGRFHDPTSLADMAAEVASLPWASKAPMAIDRALGSSGWVLKLHELGLRYITCVPAPEFTSCGAPVPWPLLDELQDCGEDLEAMKSKVLNAGFTQDQKGRYILDLGLFDKSLPKSAKRISQARLSLQMLQQIEGSSEKKSGLAERLNIARRNVFHYSKLVGLSPQIRRRIDEGDADALTLKQLQEIATSPHDKQEDLLVAMVAAAPAPYRQAHGNRAKQTQSIPALGALSVNLKRFIDDRRNDQECLASIQARVDAVNHRLATPQSRRTDASALAEVQGLIRKFKMGEICSTSMEKNDGQRQIVLHVDEKAWRKRRRSDGISLVIAHPDVHGSAVERVAQYFSKDGIEKDFETIKSVLRLRPVRHRTDEKLRAHVSVCMLALLLTRLLEHHLGKAGQHRTLAEIIEVLEPFRLNLLDDGTNRYYEVAHPSDDVLSLLRALGLEQLVDSVAITKELTPRQLAASKDTEKTPG